jgi:hypothetical protein
MERSTALSHQNVPSDYSLTIATLDPEALAYGVATVTSRALTFFVCHFTSLSGVNLRDSKGGQRGAESPLAPAILATAHLEDDELRTATVLGYLSLNASAIDVRLADLYLIAPSHKHLVERYFGTDLIAEAINGDEITFGYLVLTTTGLDNGVHGLRAPCSQNNSQS